MKNNKAFTLVEIIGVITILSLILLVSLPAITSTLKKNEQKKYDEYLNNLKMMSENYVVERMKEGLSLDELGDITLGNLIDEGYIEKSIKNPNNGQTLSRKTSVKIIKKEDGTFEYNVYEHYILPNEYILVDYIESSGTQYIDTGFIPNQDTSIEVDFQYLEITSSFLFGTRSSAKENAYAVNVSGLYAVSSYGNSGNVQYATADTGRHKIYKNKNLLRVDGNLVHTFDSQTFTAPGSLEIFAAYNNGTKGYLPSEARLFSFKIYDNDILVRDFVPCYSESNGTVGLYDLVNALFYTNQGTGTFEKGNINIDLPEDDTELPDEDMILPDEYIMVDYIESKGNQYIDTGFIPNQDTKVVIDYQYVAVTSSFLFGTRSGTKENAYTVNVSGSKAVSSYGNSGNVEYGTADTGRHVIEKSKNLLRVDGNLVHTFESQTFTAPGSLEIFAAYDNGTKGYLPSQTRLFSFKIYDNDILVRDFVPCYTKSDGTVGLYDLVNNVFYTNQGTGTFEKGDIDINSPDDDTALLEEYVLVDYIESTGLEYIDTGFIVNQDTSVEIDYQSLCITSTFLCGSRVKKDVDSYTINVSGSNAVSSYGSSGNVVYATSDTNRHQIYKNKNLLYLDGNLVSTFAIQTFTTPGSLEIFAAYNNGTKGYLPSQTRLFSFKIYDNDILVRDFVPCYRKSDGTVGLYDLVNQVFYTNQGAGEFRKGADKS